jgi:hypothetical protein
MSPIGIAKGTIYSSGGDSGGISGPPVWEFSDAASLGTPATGDVIDIIIATNVDSYRQTTGSLLSPLSLIVTNNELRLQGTLAQFGFAALLVNENGTGTIRASEYGVTRQVEIEIAGERRTFSHRQVGNLLISKQFESYGTPNTTWNGETSQKLDATQNVSASTGGCHSGSQLLSDGGVAEVTINSSNGTYGDPCQGTYKRCFAYYTI